jgi:hypothetical protein
MKCLCIVVTLILLALCETGFAEEVIIGDPVVVQIMGNANMDQFVDNDDIIYVQGIIDGKNERTKLADANNDGNVDSADIEYIKKIIAGTESELFYRDANDKVESVRHPLIVQLWCMITLQKWSGFWGTG